MGGGLDHKRFLDRTRDVEAAARLDRWLSERRVPPLAWFFAESSTAAIDDDRKPGKEILQFGFLLEDPEGRVLPHHRAGFVSKTSPSGHTITTGRSVIASWSPVQTLRGRHCPETDADLRAAIAREVPSIPGAPSPLIRFLGVVRRVRGPVEAPTHFLFYLFALTYVGAAPLGCALVKDRDDVFETEFVPIDAALLSDLAKKPVDRAALALATRTPFSHGAELMIVSAQDDPTHPYSRHAGRVFVSYASADRARVQPVVDALREAGISVWMDQQVLRSGEVWYEEADDAVAYAHCVLAFCSSAAAKSANVAHEVDVAVLRARVLGSRIEPPTFAILPVALEGERPESFVPTALKDLVAFDLRREHGRPAATAELVVRVRELLLG